MELKALLFDTRSIQKYIFSSSRLKTQIGASYLVDRVFDDVLLPVIREVCGAAELDDATWREVASPDWTAMPQKARVAYIGGGNALILLRADAGEAAAEIVRRFSKELLVRCPGLQTGAAIGTVDLASDGSWLSETANRTALVLKLKEQQNTAFPRTTIPYTGLTLAADGADETATSYDASRKRYIAESEAAKLRVATPRHDGGALQPARAEKALLEKLTSVLTDEEKSRFMENAVFPSELDKLGQKETENYIAVVHIDGNNMGKKFADLTTLSAYKNKSQEIRTATIRAFAELVLSMKEDSFPFLAQRKDGEKRRYLPVRPLILGGDDMTFVCAAKVAFDCTAFIMKSLLEKGVDTCAGVAILPTAYPFFRGYEIAEQLCDSAKGRMRKLANEREGLREEASCWLDFLRLHGEQAPTLAEIRRQEYRAALGSLHFGPYRIDGESHYAFARLRELAEGLSKSLPSGKLKDLRAVLQHGEHEAEKYLEQIRHDGYALPQPAGWEAYAAHLWQEHGGRMRTPFVEAIELSEFLPPKSAHDGKEAS